MLKINNLEVSTDGKTILKDFNLIINDGEIHAIMGPNGVGKSTLSRVIMGDSNYKVLNGEMTFNGDNLMILSTDERAKKGIFLAMQYPMEIEGVSNQDFLRTAIGSVNNKRIGLYDFILKCEKGGKKLQSKAGRGLFLALLLFVGIPVPGTGAWTGTLAASILDLDFKKTVGAVMCGVLLAGIIMAIFSYGLLGVIG